MGSPEYKLDDMETPKKMPGILECMSHIKDGVLRYSLACAYRALTEGNTVNNTFTPLYKLLLSTGDWVRQPSGEHEVYLRLNVPDEFKKYATKNFSQSEARLGPFLGKLAFSGTNNSDSHGLKNMIRDIRLAYKMACQCEYELCGHDTKKMVWPGKAKKFMDAYYRGAPVWTPPNYPEGNGAVTSAAEPESKYMVTVDGQTYEQPWMKYKNQKRR